MKKLLLFLCLNFIIIQNLFSQEIFTVDTSKVSIQLNSKQTNLLNIIRNRISSEKVSLIKNVEVNKLRSLGKISIEIHGKEIVNFQRKSIKSIDENTTLWTGENNGNKIILVFTGDDITGSITLKNEKFKIEPIGNGLHVIIKFDETKLPPEYCENLETTLPDSLKSNEKRIRMGHKKNNIHGLDKIN